MSDKKERRGEGQTSVKTRETTKKPHLYKVIIHNDDYTTQEFVVVVLCEFFHKGQEEATRLMLSVHTKGRAIVGAFTHDIAESKIEKVTRVARENGHPLLLTMEPE